MGNQNGCPRPDISTEPIQISDFSSSDVASPLHSASSSDSEPNNNLKFFFSHDEPVVSQATQYCTRPRKIPKISRAASVGGIRRKKAFSKFPGFTASSSSSSGFMSESLCAILNETWQTVLAVHDGDPAKIGLAIYSKIFSRAPELRDVFFIPKGVYDVFDYEPFSRSALLMGSVIGLCVRNTDNLEGEMGPVLVMYGRRHYHREAQGFRVSYMPLFGSCICDVINDSLGDLRSPESDIAWHKLISYISNRITEGVDLERYRIERMGRKTMPTEKI